MENTFFKFLLVLFGFFLGGIFPISLSDCSWYIKMLFLFFAVHLSENYWLQNIIKQTGSIIKKSGIIVLFGAKKSNNWFFKGVGLITSIIKNFLVQLFIIFEYIKLGFFFGIFVDALKVGS